jgi:hypothetical protein
METNLFTVKLVLLFFWTAWFFITFLTNLFGGMKALGLLPAKWKFASDNFQAVAHAASIYRAPGRLAALLFSGVVLWQILVVTLFGRALILSFKMGSLEFISLNTAFTAGIAFWAALMIADEVFLRYENQSWHALLFIAQLVTWMSLYVLPF